MLINRRVILTAAFAVATAATLAACGFQLRGANGGGALPFQSIFLQFTEASTLGTELRRYIRNSSDTKVVAVQKQAQVILEVLSETREKSVLSLNTQGRVREYTLHYKLNFRVTNNDGKELLATTEISLKRDISFNESQILAKESEEALLYRDMQTDLVQQILRRLAAIELN